MYKQAEAERFLSMMRGLCLLSRLQVIQNGKRSHVKQTVSTVKYSVFALLGSNNSNFCYQSRTVKLTSMLILLSVVNNEFKLCLIYILFFTCLSNWRMKWSMIPWVKKNYLLCVNGMIDRFKIIIIYKPCVMYNSFMSCFVVSHDSSTLFSRKKCLRPLLGLESTTVKYLIHCQRD